MLQDHRLPEPQEDDSYPDASQTKKVLLVEDNLDLADLSAEILESFGYEVVHAENADIALVCLEQTRFDLLLTDVVMPGSMNGVGLAKITRQRFPLLPILLVTGYADEDSLTDLQLFPLLRKPYRIGELIKKMDELGVSL
jgi:CheY-like chemotaxis protein